MGQGGDWWNRVATGGTEWRLVGQGGDWWDATWPSGMLRGQDATWPQLQECGDAEIRRGPSFRSAVRSRCDVAPASVLL